MTKTMLRFFITTGNKQARLFFVILFISFIVTIFSACTLSQMPQPDTKKLSAVRKSNTKTTKTLTSFTESLRCVDHLLALYKYPEILLDVEVSEEVSESVVGIKDMVMTSLSNMSATSNAIKVIAKSPAQDLFYEYSEKQQFKAPDYFIRLSPPQIESGYISNKAAFDAQVPVIPGSLAASAAVSSSIISLDMNMGSHHTLQLIPGVNARNSIILVSASEKIDISVGNANQGDDAMNPDYEENLSEDELSADDELSEYKGYDDQPRIGKLTKFGTTFKLNFGYRDGKHVAIRTLIELGVIELIGKYTKVPYRNCLDDPNVRSKPAVKQENVPNLKILVEPRRQSKNDYKSGDSVEVNISVTKDALVYCYYEDYSNSIHQILPTPYRPSNRVNSAKGIVLPGNDGFQIEIDSGKGYDQIFCIAHESPVDDHLPSGLVASNLKKLPYKSFDDLLHLHRLADTKLAVSNVFSFRGR